MRKHVRLVLSIGELPGMDALVIESDDPDEYLWDAMKRAIVDRHGPEGAQGFAGSDEGWRDQQGWYWTDPEDASNSGLVWTGGPMTVRQMAAFLGDEAEDNALTMGWGGGGDGDLFGTARSILELVGDGTVVWGAIQGARALTRRFLNRDRARMMADYRDGASLSMPLEQSIRALTIWDQRRFLRVYSTDPTTAARIMGELGYRAATHGSSRHWEESGP